MDIYHHGKRFLCSLDEALLDAMDGSAIVTITHPVRCYGAFLSWDLFAHWYRGLQIRHVDEVIMDVPQKFRLDIDVPAKVWMDEGTWATIIDTIDATLRSTFVIHGMDPTVIRYYSHSPTSNKRSCHMVVCNYVFDDHNQCRSLCYAIKAAVGGQCAGYIDGSVYKAVQNFRIEGSSKPSEDRPKVRWCLSPSINGLLDGMVTCTKDTRPITDSMRRMIDQWMDTNMIDDHPSQ
jgi:hypothetical protein